MASEALVHLENLTIDYWHSGRWQNVVNGVSCTIAPGEAVGLVGESGCGKTTTAFSLLGYRRPGSRIRAGRLRFDGHDVLSLKGAALQRLRGAEVSLVPQDPTTALTPNIRIGDQLVEAMAVHGVGGSRADRRDRAVQLIEQVMLPEPIRIAKRYPHELSGGQQQRVTIAMALACGPRLLVLDEPTTGLDVTTQAQILDLLKGMREEIGMAMVYVTHDLAVVSTLCDRVGVMYAGELVEDASTDAIFRRPRHPYTRGLIASVADVQTPGERDGRLRGLLERNKLPPGCRFAPRCDFATERCHSQPQTLEPVGAGHRVACCRWLEIPEPDTAHHAPGARSATQTQVSDQPLLEVEGLICSYPSKRGVLRRTGVSPVVRNVSFTVDAGETFALVGESGSGKSTIARTLAGLLNPTGGSIRFEGRPLAPSVRHRSKDARRAIQLVFQNPDASLNPRARVAEIVGRPLELFFGASGKARRAAVERYLDDVRLAPSFATRYPAELSGGERQRVALARALAAEPRLLLCDEIVSALDVSVQAEILDLLRDLRREHAMAYLFISHDLAVVRSLSQRVAVLYHGELCEIGEVSEVYSAPSHPYTDMLLSAVPQIDTGAPGRAVRDDPASVAGGPRTACPFAPRCPSKVGDICDREAPPWRVASEGHAIRCHIPVSELAQPETSRT